MCSWTLTGPAKPEDCTAQISNLTLDAIHVDELPYAHLRPGNVMTFVADGFEELQKGCAPHSDYPLPQDHLLVFHDVARCWIGQTERIGRPSSHSHWLIAALWTRQINYRRTYQSA